MNVEECEYYDDGECSMFSFEVTCDGGCDYPYNCPLEAEE